MFYCKQLSNEPSLYKNKWTLNDNRLSGRGSIYGPKSLSL